MMSGGKFRQFAVFIPMIAGGLAVLFLLTFVSLMKPSGAASAPDSGMNLAGEQPSAILARRAISIPYGIASPLPLSSDGQSVQVSGHGACSESGEYFQLRVNVTQDSTGAKAMGRTEGECPGTEELFTWSSNAFAQGPKSFEQGSAQACGMVVIHNSQEGAVTYRWCKDVILE